MVKRLSVIIVLVAFAVCAVAVAQQRRVIDEARFGTVEVKRTHSHIIKPAGVLVVPWHINYQGYLTDDAGNPINDTLSMTFGIWDDPGVGSELWNENGNVVVEEGLFNVVLGSTTPIPSDVFGAGLSRWLELTIVAQTLSPRTEITSVGYAYRSVKADSADDAGMVDGFDASATPGAGDLFPLSAGDVQYVNEGQTDAITSDMIVDGTVVRGDAEAAFKAPYADTADYAFAAPVGSDGDWTIAGSVLHPSSSYGLAMRSFNVLYGVYDTTHVNLGIACTTGTSGQDRAFCTVSGGYNNSAGYDYATVGGGSGNMASGYHGTVSGGENSSAIGQYAVVGGGRDNTASGNGAAIGGGGMNTVNGTWAVVGGGGDNAAAGNLATVGGGESNTADSAHATVSGGRSNTASADYATVGGGQNNTADNTWATVGGGMANEATAGIATVCGGRQNTANDFYATVGGGDQNTASGNSATVGGGYNNNASGDLSTVGGGSGNTASNSNATVGGGAYNRASGQNTTVAGGYQNAATGNIATVAGGYADTVAGDFAFAAGRLVRITGAGDFTFAFGRNFTTSTPNAVIFHNSVDPIRVGMGTTSPTATLDVNGSTGYDQVRMRTSYTPTSTADANGNVGDVAWDDDYMYMKTSAGWKRAALSTW